MTEPTRLLTYYLPDAPASSAAVDFAVKLTGAYVGDVSVYKHDDAAETVILTFKAPGELDNSIFAIDRAGNMIRLERTVNGKDGTGGTIVYRDGSIRTFTCEADEKGQSGGTAGVWMYDWPTHLALAVGDGDSTLVARIVALEAALDRERLTRQQADAWLRDAHLLTEAAQAIIRAIVKEELQAAFARALGI